VAVEVCTFGIWCFNCGFAFACQDPNVKWRERESVCVCVIT
jgi:hypothetical protein